MADYVKMNEIRARIDSIVTDKSTAESLKPWYNLFCKRPGYSDEFLQAFNQPNVHLIDTEGRGVDRITEKGVVVARDRVRGGLPHLRHRLLHRPASVPGRRLRRSSAAAARTWESTGRTAVKSVHGIMTHGFPNLFIHGHACDATLTVNVPHALGEQSVHVAALVAQSLRDGARTIEVTAGGRGRLGGDDEGQHRRPIEVPGASARPVTSTTRARRTARAPWVRRRPDPVHGAAREVASRAHG